MPDQALLDLIDFLEKTDRKVLRIEAEGDEVLAEQGQDAFDDKLREKAQVLAALVEDTAEFVDRLDPDLAEKVGHRLRHFSATARYSLRIDSVFFMTALLYPEDHVVGQPNDLENFIQELKKMA